MFRLSLTLVFRRTLRALLIVVGVTSVAFIVARTLPGEPVRMLVGPRARPADVERAKQIYGLDQPLWVQYQRFWSRLVHAPPKSSADEEHRHCSAVGPVHIDLGFSYRYRKPVAALVAKKAPASAELALAAVTIQLSIGVALGIAAALGRRRLWDPVLIGATTVITSVPIFAIGLLLQLALAVRLGWLPQDGYSDAGGWSHLRHLFLPALTLGFYGTALYARLTRQEVSETLEARYATASRARGASEVFVVRHHALRNALLPVMTLSVLELGSLIGGTVVTEKLFRWPGLGSMAVDAMVNRDGPVIMAAVLLGAVAVVASTLVVDLLALVFDPRLRRPP